MILNTYSRRSQNQYGAHGTASVSAVRGDTTVLAPSTAFLFDVRVFNKAITESGGLGDDPSNNDLGAISYVFKDMEDNEGKVHLPFG